MNFSCKNRNFRFFLAKIARNVASRSLGTKPSFYKSQETAPKSCQRVSKAHSKKLAKSRLQFLSRSFYLPRCYCTNKQHNLSFQRSLKSWTKTPRRGIRPWLLVGFSMNYKGLNVSGSTRMDYDVPSGLVQLPVSTQTMSFN